MVSPLLASNWHLASNIVTMDYDDLILLLILLELDEDEEAEEEAARERDALMRNIIPRAALMDPDRSPFRYLYRSGRNDALICLCGFDFPSYHRLLAMFAPVYNAWTPYPQSASNRGNMRRLRRRPGKRRGRRRLLDATACLALVLAWSRTSGSMKALQLIFGITANPLSVWLRFGRRIVVAMLRDHPDAAVREPTSEQITAYKMAISALYPDLVDVWAMMDGLKLRIEMTAVRREIQNMFYNGWHHDHFVSNLFLFTPDGLIRMCYLNAPGTWHDSSLANRSGIYARAQTIHERELENGNGGAKIVADSAFGACTYPCLIKSHQYNIDRNGNERLPHDVWRAAVSVRQASEWGMRALQGSFPRLKDRIHYEEVGERKIILSMIVLLCNYRTRTVGFNQIRTTYMPHLEENAARFANM